MAKAKARSQVYKEMEERVPLNTKKKDHGLEENSTSEDVKSEDRKLQACGHSQWKGERERIKEKGIVAVVYQSS